MEIKIEIDMQIELEIPYCILEVIIVLCVLSYAQKINFCEMKLIFKCLFL